MCNPPANRSKAAISALRQHGFGTSTRLSSSLTAAVIAIASLTSCTADSLGAQDRVQCRGQRGGIVPWGTFVGRHRSKLQTSPQRLCGESHRNGLPHSPLVSEDHIHTQLWHVRR